jgi:hypothetical protein
MLAAVLLMLLGLCDYGWLPASGKRYAEAYLDESILLAVGTYATCRTINAGVSSLQESGVSVSPWGVGIQYQIGQLLDPINDATERLSDICVTSMGLLSAQRLLVFAINQYTILPFYLAALLALIAYWVPHFDKAALRFGQLALVLLLIRLSIPGMCWVGTSLDAHYFSPNMQVQMDQLSEVKDIALAEFDETHAVIAIEGDISEGAKEPDGLFAGFRTGLERYYDAVKHRAGAIQEALAYFKSNFDRIAESLTLLFVLFLEKIIVQVFALPILTYLLVRKIYQLCIGDRLDRTLVQLRDAIRLSSTAAGRAASQ